jgi:hypothetical protein
MMMINKCLHIFDAEFCFNKVEHYFPSQISPSHQASEQFFKYCESTLFSLVPIFLISTKCIDSWLLEFVVSIITCNNQWENCISLEFDFCGFKWTTKSAKLRTPRLIMMSHYIMVSKGYDLMENDDACLVSNC